MAEWKTSGDFGSVTYISGTGSQSSDYFHNRIKVQLQYYTDPNNPVKCTVRFYITSTTNGGSDSMYILYNPTDAANRKLFKIKPYTGSGSAYSTDYPYVSSSFTVTKNADAANFEFKDFWIYNGGYDDLGKDSNNKNITWANLSENTTGANNIYYSMTNHSRKTKSDKTSGKGKKMSGYVATQVSGGTINSLVDNGDNTFTVKGTIGNASGKVESYGTSLNSVTSGKLWWGWRNTSDTGWEWQTNGVNNSQAFSSTAPGTTSTKSNIAPPIRDDRADTLKIVACTETFGTYSIGGKTSAESTYVTLDLKQYVAPEGPTYILVTTTDSDTMKANCTWQIHWMPGTPYNNNAAVENYYISILKNGDPVDLVDAYGAYFGTKFSVESLSEADNYFTFNPAINGFKAGDDLQVLVSAYIVDKKYNVYESWPCYSNIYTIENDTNAYIKVDSNWKPAVLYTRVGTDWKKVDEIFKLPIDDGWLG